MNKEFARVGAIALLSVLLAAMLQCGAQLAHGKTTPPRNSLGAIVYTDNPFIYKAGAVLEATNVKDNLNLRINPLGTYQLFDENILICGLPIELFEGKVNPVVLTYTRSAPRMVDGIPCHQLIRVDNMEKTQ